MDLQTSRAEKPFKDLTLLPQDCLRSTVALQNTRSCTSFPKQDLTGFEWYVGEWERHEAENVLFQNNIDGAFLVRESSKKSSDKPYVLVVYYGNKVYNVEVRYLSETQQYALGTGLRGDVKFNSVSEIIEFHKHCPILLIDGKDKSGIQREKCILTHPLQRY
ncbi:cytokine-dependent hematopoietic cell linker [Latimeria chalumnae]|uniref:cytokine-dependent hematopoietic cell linker n=1 Tax=Latimeria chalumnae TaxID=7897 RepID=UPI0003C17D40|nr:PREDICTED: cytokine-dependent hematopoietic cell linker [Latimeria chalumnae]|eukprot:XP_005995863.1 PREDICTED: cytokine-dependent hematopoietic cell linker [Latimeria chalumnae]